VADRAGNLYGMTFKFGTGTAGIVYELSPPASQGGAWTEQVLFDFSTQSDVGAQPQQSDPLLMDPSGALYGTATAAVDGGWNLTTLWAFSGPPSDGANPQGGLVVDPSGTLYGTTQAGTSSAATLTNTGEDAGANPCTGDNVTPGCGTVFELTGTGFVVTDGGI
jgi:hypothetical protein